MNNRNGQEEKTVLCFRKNGLDFALQKREKSCKLEIQRKKSAARRVWKIHAGGGSERGVSPERIVFEAGKKCTGSSPIGRVRAERTVCMYKSSGAIIIEWGEGRGVYLMVWRDTAFTAIGRPLIYCAHAGRIGGDGIGTPEWEGGDEPVTRHKIR